MKFSEFSKIYDKAKAGCLESVEILSSLGVVTEREFQDSADYVVSPSGHKTRARREYFSDGKDEKVVDKR